MLTRLSYPISTTTKINLENLSKMLLHKQEPCFLEDICSNFPHTHLIDLSILELHRKHWEFVVVLFFK